MAAEKREKAEASLRFDEIEARMRDRLQAYLREFSQADIARRTGVRHQNVHRYLTNTRVPAAFCSVLIEDLNVNARWLMTGEGAPTATDIREDAQMKAGGLLELVDAMNAVGRMRLGTLLGNENLKVLRELGDALDRYEGIKRSLAAQARQSHEQVLSSLDKAIDEKNHALARELCEVGEQVSRLCDDEKLNARFDAIRSRIEFWWGNPDDALRYSRRSHLRLMLGDERASSPEFYDNAIGFIGRLGLARRTREACSRCEALLAMSAEIPEVASKRESLLMHRSQFDCDLGNPGRAADTTVAVYPFASDALREGHSCIIVAAILLSGRGDISSAIGVGVNNPLKVMELLTHTATMEDFHALRLVAKHYLDEPVQPILPDVDAKSDLAHVALKIGILRVRCMIALLEKGDAALLPEYLGLLQRRVQDVPGAVFIRAALHVYSAQMLRLADRRDEALQQTRQSVTELASIGPEFTAKIEMLATHHRNVLMLIPADSSLHEDRQLRAASQRSFDVLLAQGYGCFRAWASKPANLKVPQT